MLVLPPHRMTLYSDCSADLCTLSIKHSSCLCISSNHRAQSSSSSKSTETKDNQQSKRRQAHNGYTYWLPKTHSSMHSAQHPAAWERPVAELPARTSHGHHHQVPIIVTPTSCSPRGDMTWCTQSIALGVSRWLVWWPPVCRLVKSPHGALT